LVSHRHLLLTSPRWVVLVALAAFLAACGAHVHHRVRPGETLYAIGWRYGVDYRTLARWNGIEPPYTIHPGQVLRVAPPRRDVWERKKAGAEDVRSSPPPVKKTSPPTAPSKEPPAGGAIAWRWPVQGPILRPFRLQPPVNKGIDIGGRFAAPVRAAAAGEVVYAGQGLVGYGNLVIVKHDQNFLSAYAHNETLLVKEGDRVSAGQVIARMGRDNRGRVALHFEIRRRGKPVDPLKLLPRRGG